VIHSLYKRGGRVECEGKLAKLERNNNRASSTAISRRHELRSEVARALLVDSLQVLQHEPRRDPRRTRHPVHPMQRRDAHPATRADPDASAADDADGAAGVLPPLPGKEARRPDRHLVRRRAAGLRPAGRPHQRCQVHEAAPLPELRLPWRLHHHALWYI
jgi:hypothetical protein